MLPSSRARRLRDEARDDGCDRLAGAYVATDPTCQSCPDLRPRLPPSPRLPLVTVVRQRPDLTVQLAVFSPGI